MEDLVVVGRVIRAHGLRGELVVDSDGDSLLGMGEEAIVWLGDPPEPHGWLAARPHKGRVLLTVIGVADRTAAEAQRGALVRLPASSRRPLSEDEIWVEDLIGARLRTEDGTLVGTVTGLVESAARDLLEVETGAGVIHLIPMVRDWLVELRLQDGEIVMRLPAGLVPEDGTV